MEMTAECISTKLRAKYRVPQEIIAVKKKCDDARTASLCNKRNQTNANTQKIKKAQSELTNTYLKEQTEYVQDQINKIRQSQIAWQTVNEVTEKAQREQN